MSISTIVKCLAKTALLLAASIASGAAYAQVPLSLGAGWNLLGNSSAAAVDVAATFGDATKITTVWTWNRITSKWAFYTPSMTPSALTAYAQGKGYEVLNSVAPKEGFWVNASTAVTLAGPAANGVMLVEGDLQQGWNLLGSADGKTPSQLNQALDASLNAAGKAIVTVWAWDAPSTKWKFHAPSLEAQAGTALADYIAGKGYLPFDTALSIADGFWLNIGAARKGDTTTTTTATTATSSSTTTVASTTTTTQAATTGPFTLTIVKDAQPDDAQAFQFTTVGAGLSDFNLVDNGTPPNSKTFANLAAGSYTVTEVAMSGWSTSGTGYQGTINCYDTGSGSHSTNTPTTNSVTVHFVAGNIPNVICTFINVKTATTGTTTSTTTTSAPATTTTSTAISTSTTTVATTTTTTQVPTTTGSLTIVKDAVPNNAQDFAFYAFGPNSGSIMPFLLDDDAGAVGADNILSNSKTFSNLAPGSYSVKEDFFNPVPVTGWDSTGIVCASSTGTPVGTVDLAIHAFTVNLAAGENVTCTFTNVKTPATGTGTLTIVKDAQPDDAQAFHFTTAGAGLSDFDLDDDPTNNTLLNAKTFTNLAAGVPFTVTESAVAGWTVPSVQCLVAVPGSTMTSTDQLNRTFTVNLEAGANVTCTFTNVKTSTAATGPFNLTIVKDAQPDDPQDFHFTTVGAGLSPFDLDDDPSNGALSNSKTFTNLAAGSYSVTEVAMNGWAASGNGYQGTIRCDQTGAGTYSIFTPTFPPSTNSIAMNLVAGDKPDITCTFINVKTPPPTFTAISAPTLQVSTQAMMPTVLMTSLAFTSTTTGGVTTATVTAGPGDGIRTLANPYPGDTLIGAVATLPSTILLASGIPALSMTATSCGGTSGGSPCPAASLIPLASSDFGVWAIRNDMASPLPANSLITYSAYAGGTQLTTSMPASGSVTYHGKMTGVLSNTPVGGSDNVNADVSLTVNFANGTISGSLGLLPGIATGSGASTITPCVYPVSAPACTYAVYAPLQSPALNVPFDNIAVNGSVSGNAFAATVTTPSIAAATTTTMTGRFYGATANEIAGTFTISVPVLGSPGAGLILIGSFGAK